MAWKPACRPASVHATTWSRTAGGVQVAVPGVRRRRRTAGAGGAVCEPIDAVGEQVAGRAERAELPGAGHAAEAGSLAPVADDLGPRLGRGQLQHRDAGRRRRRCRGRTARAAARCPGRRRARGWPAAAAAALSRGDRLAGDPADDVMRVAGQVAGVRPAVLAARLGHRGEQGRGDHGGVHVDAGEVDHSAVRRPVELLAGRGPVLRPGRLVPAVPEHDAAAGGAAGRLDPPQAVGQAGARRSGRGRSAPARSRSRARARRRTPG